MYKCKMTEIFYKNSPYYYSSKPRQQVHNNQGMDFYLKYRWYTIIKQCKKKILQLAMLYNANVIMYHLQTLKKCCKCLMFKTILPDNVPRASFIYVRRLQLRMNINEHPLIRNSTLFCLKQYIYMNQLYKLSDSMCSVA